MTTVDDVDVKLATLLKREVDAGRRDFRAEARAMAAELRRDELAALKAEVEGPARARRRVEFLNDPVVERRAEAGRLALELRAERDPEYAAMVASAKRFRAKREAASWRRALVAGCLLPGAGDLSKPYSIGARLVTGLTAAVQAGDRTAETLLASVVARRGRDINAAVVASGQPGWQVRRVGEHKRAERATFHGDGTITREVRWKFRGSGEWLTSRQFQDRQRRARERARSLRRQIPTVGRVKR